MTHSSFTSCYPPGCLACALYEYPHQFVLGSVAKPASRNAPSVFAGQRCPRHYGASLMQTLVENRVAWESISFRSVARVGAEYRAKQYRLSVLRGWKPTEQDDCRVDTEDIFESPELFYAPGTPCAACVPFPDGSSPRLLPDPHHPG